MPTYSYACTSCDHRFDVQQAFTDEPLRQCPECSARLRKLFGSVGVVFKGSGFYRTDARADRRGTPKAAPAAAAPSGAGGTGSTSSGNGTAGTSHESSKTAAPASVPAAAD